MLCRPPNPHRYARRPRADARAAVPQETAISTTVRRRGTARAAIAVTASTAVLASGLAACGTVERISTADKVSTAFGRLGDARNLTVEVSLDATADQLIALSKASEDSEPLERSEAQMITDLKLTVSIGADGPLKDVGPSAQSGPDGLTGGENLDVGYELAARNGGRTYLDVRQVGATVYAKADAVALAGLSGDTTADARSMVDSLPPELKTVKDGLSGRWVSLDPALLTEFTAGARGVGGAGAVAPKGTGPGSPGARPSADAAAADEMFSSLKDVVARNVTFDDLGTHDGVEHIRLNAPVRPLMEGLLGSVRPGGTTMPGFPVPVPGFPGGLDRLDDSGAFPNRTVRADLYLKGGSLSSVVLDLAQLEDKAGLGLHVPLRLSLSDHGTAPQAPTGAEGLTRQDVDGFMAFVQSQEADAGGDFGGGFGSGFGPDGFGPGDVEPGDLAPGKPLTDAQIKELVAGGLRESTVRMMNESGLDYEDIKRMLPKRS
ncbi:hypothetical protein [Kitasatospora sp. NPDC088346]|uniref:hypothetical protein n=1 Tax=Kitasatospora sp. NPDC088346 TaxID=3364073 RepID=UPI003812B5FA